MAVFAGVGLRVADRADRAVGGGAVGDGAVVRPVFVFEQALGLFDRAVGKVAFKLDAPCFSCFYNALRLDGADGHRAAHAGFYAARHGRPFFHRDAAE